MRHTKIVATIGPVCDSPEQIKRMIEAGVDVFRFNMKHADTTWHSERMERVEAVCEELKVRVAMLIDLQGPEVRIDTVPEELAEIEIGQQFKMSAPGGEGVTLDHPEIFPHLKAGQTIYADDGFLEFLIEKVEERQIEVKVVEGGKLKPRKTVNFPGAHLDFPTLIEKDLEHLSLAARHHVDFVALSFVRSVADIERLREALEEAKIQSKVIAKIEHPEAVEHFDEILDTAEGIMVARGDLGIEYPMEEVPALQKLMVKRCREAGKPVIIATQMIESMIEHPRPTRAEVSDVANAVYDGADAIMLSAESAAGKYPVRVVKTMARIAERAEDAAEYAEVKIDWEQGGQTAAVVAAANFLMNLRYRGVGDLKAFVALTETGRTVEYLSRLRPRLPIFALSSDKKTLDQLKLSYGVQPVYYDYSKEEQVKVAPVMERVKEVGGVAPGDKVVMIYGEEWGEPGLTSVVRIQEVV